MDARVTIIPISNEALQAVDTPYVALQHPFKDRPGRYARQADLLDTDGSAGWTVGDVWPACVHQPYLGAMLLSATLQVLEGRFRFGNYLWPEGILYRTEMAQLFPLDERVVYRPQMAYWARLCEEMGGRFAYDGKYTSESVIEVPHRATYPAGERPSVRLAAEKLPLTVIMITENHASVVGAAIDSLLWQTFVEWELVIVDCGSTDGTKDRLKSLQDSRIGRVRHAKCTRAAACNLALESARGEYVAIWEPGHVAVPDRLERQLAMRADLIGSRLVTTNVHGEQREVPSDDLIYSHTRLSGRSVLPLGTMMIHRRVFERHGGFESVLSVRYGHELQLRVLTDRELSYAKITEPLVMRTDEANDEPVAYGFLYDTLVGRDVAMRYGVRDGIHTWLLCDR